MSLYVFHWLPQQGLVLVVHAMPITSHVVPFSSTCPAQHSLQKLWEQGSTHASSRSSEHSLHVASRSTSRTFSDAPNSSAPDDTEFTTSGVFSSSVPPARFLPFTSHSTLASPFDGPSPSVFSVKDLVTSTVSPFVTPLPRLRPLALRLTLVLASDNLSAPTEGDFSKACPFVASPPRLRPVTLCSALASASVFASPVLLVTVPRRVGLPIVWTVSTVGAVSARWSLESLLTGEGANHPEVPPLFGGALISTSEFGLCRAEGDAGPGSANCLRLRDFEGSDSCSWKKWYLKENRKRFS